MGERPSTVRNRSSSSDRDTAAPAARSATVHFTSGDACSSASAGASTGSCSAASQPWSAAGAVARWSRSTSTSTSSGKRVVTRLVLVFDGAVSSSAYVMLACTHPDVVPSGIRTTNAGGNTRSAGSNSGSSE